MPDTAPPGLAPPDRNRGYRPAVVSRYTGLPVRTIYVACQRGEIDHSRVGRAYIIPGREVLRLIGAAP